MKRMAIVAVTAVALVFSACSKPPLPVDVGGDVFITMKSGDVKRGADVEVCLVPVSPKFDAEWGELAATYTANYASAVAALKVASSESDRLRAAAFKDILNNAKRDAWLGASTRAGLAAGRVDAVTPAYRAEAMKLVAREAKAVMRTDVNGHYEFKGPPAGRYYVFARYIVFSNDVQWKIPVDLKPGPQKVDLSNSNSGWSATATPAAGA